MNSKIVKLLLITVVLGSVAMDADAQRGRRRRTTTPGTDTAQTQQQQQVNQQTNPGATKYNPFGNVPIVVEAATGAGLNDTIKKSMRNDAAYEKGMVKERTPLDYEHLRFDDALYTERVWREIDIREKINMPFRYKAEDDNGDQRFISILLGAVRKGEVTAFSPDDDRFTTPLALDQVQQTIAGGSADTIPVYDVTDPTKIIQWKVVQKEFNLDDVVRFRIKEDWVFDREASRLFVRILGIAPLKMVYREDGTERGTTPMFWIYYPDLRPTLAKYEVYNPKNMGMGRMTWEELFEARMFSSYVVKSTLDNPQNKNIRQYIKDPILALLEGDNIKEKIFNYEQNLWSY